MLYNTRLGKVISTLEAKELKEFSKFLKGFYNGEETIPGRLLDLIRNQDGLNLQNEVAWKLIKPDQPFNANRFNRYLTDLLGVLREFLRYRKLADTPWLPELLELQYMNQPSLKAEFESVWKHNIKPLTELSVATPDQLHMLFEAWKERHNFSMMASKPKYRSHYKEINETFDHYWILQKIIFACINHSINQNRPDDEKIETRYIQDLITIWDGDNLRKELPLYGIYRDLYEIQTDGANFEIEKVLDQLDAVIPLLPAIDATLLFRLFLNEFYRLHNLAVDRTHSFGHYLRLYEIGIKYGLLLSGGYIQEVHYYAIILAYLNTGENKKAFNFLVSWKKNLLPEIREEIFILMKTIYYFYQGDYQEVLVLTNGPKLSHPFYEVQIRICRIKALYECKYHPESTSAWKKEKESLLHFCKGLASFIRTQKELTGLDKSLFLNTLKTIRKLVLTQNPQTLKDILKEMEEGLRIDEKEWIIKKIRARIRREFGE